MVTLHAWRVPRGALPRALWRMALDRGRLRRTPGVSFAKLLGTGRDLHFGPTGADPGRWAAVIAWDDASAAERFDDSPVGRAWAEFATARCRLALRPVTSRGAWAGRSPFEVTDSPRTDGPVLALTRARLQPVRAAAFWRAIPDVAATLPAAPGLLAAFGIGEAPLGWQGTVSVWRGSADLVGFAYGPSAHRAVVAATPLRRWYAEELFARFSVLDVDGDRGVLGWNGRDDRR
nr:monooxygenase [Planosporangium mesophilum]